MTMKPKLLLQANIPVTITFNKCFKKGSGKWGKWWAYDVICNGSEMIFFTNDLTQDLINPYLINGAGTITLEKEEKEDSLGFNYKVIEGSRKTAEAVFKNDLKKSEQVMEQTEDNKKWEKIRQEKADGQAWGNAKTNATNVTLAFFNNGKITTDEFKSKFVEIANWIYRLEPNPDESEISEEEINI